MRSFGQTRSRVVGAVVGGVLLVCGLAGMVSAHGDHLAVARIYGRTYGEWSAQWWQWAHAFPAATNPLLQEGPVDCSRGQSGPVWFLAGTLGGEADRTCAIPHGKALLFPLVNADFVNVPGDCGRAEGCTEAEKRHLLEAHLNQACQLASTLDGVPTVFSHITVRTQSPIFRVAIGDDDVFGLPAGTVDEAAVADGFWVLLPPLSTGEHVLRFQGSLCAAETREPFLTVEVIYHLTIAPHDRP
jgi:hypothetical protein